MELEPIIDALAKHLPAVIRWAGAVAKRLRYFDITLEGKTSGSASTDALTLADLTLQELIVAALRDCDPIFRQCRMQAEEETGDLAIFSDDGPYVLSIDPIDGTKQYSERSANGYAVMLHLRDESTVHYSLVFGPESGEHGTWVEARGNTIICCPDDPSKPAREVLDAAEPIDPATRPESKKIYLIGFQKNDPVNAQLVTEAGLEGVAPDDMPGSIYELLARGDFGGSLIHTPNVYDFPVALHIARILGGDALWTHTGQPVNFSEMWNDDRADMLRIPGIAATSPNADTLKILCDLAKDWPQNRYEED